MLSKYFISSCCHFPLLLAQTSTAGLSSGAPVPIATTLISPAVTEANQIATSNNGWITTDHWYSKYVGQGMRPAAASYLVELQFGVTDNSFRDNDAALYSIVGHGLSGADNVDPDDFNEVTRQSINRYFIEALPTRDEELQSSVASVWESYQGITADASESSRFHSLVAQQSSKTAVQTFPSRAAATKQSKVVQGTILGVLIWTLGFF